MPASKDTARTRSGRQESLRVPRESGASPGQEQKRHPAASAAHARSQQRAGRQASGRVEHGAWSMAGTPGLPGVPGVPGVRGPGRHTATGARGRRDTRGRGDGGSHAATALGHGRKQRWEEGRKKGRRNEPEREGQDRIADRAEATLPANRPTRVPAAAATRTTIQRESESAPVPQQRLLFPTTTLPLPLPRRCKMFRAP